MSGIVTAWNPDAPSLGACLTAIGVFDGVHLGHQSLIRDLVARAGSRGVRPVVLTFDCDPELVVNPEQAAPQLMSLGDKLDALAGLGADTLLVVPFDEHVAALTPERFVEDVLTRACSPAEVAVGEDFRFGARAAGDVAALVRLGAAHGFGVHVHPLVTIDGRAVSSTAIRALLSRGDVATAASLLTRAHRVRGTVVHGRGEGRSLLGIPTANLRSDPNAAMPAEGVYAGAARVGTQVFPAAISVGLAPTFAEAPDVIEAHLIGYEGALYGSEIALDFYERLRAQRRFTSTDALARAMHVDIATAETIARTWRTRPPEATARPPEDPPRDGAAR
jgi:riboflavin kinase/FMN adenylyltransferase